MKSKARIAFFLLIPLLLVALFVAIRLSPAQLAPLEITFQRFESDGTAVVFLVRNPNSADVAFAPAMPHEQRPHGWMPVIPPTAGVQHLRPDSEAEFTVPVPTNAIIWRVPVIWLEIPTTMDFLREALTQNVQALAEGLRPPGFHVGIGISANHTNYTPAITNKSPTTAWPKLAL